MQTSLAPAEFFISRFHRGTTVIGACCFVVHATFSFSGSPGSSRLQKAIHMVESKQTWQVREWRLQLTFHAVELWFLWIAGANSSVAWTYQAIKLVTFWLLDDRTDHNIRMKWACRALSELQPLPVCTYYTAHALSVSNLFRNIQTKFNPLKKATLHVSVVGLLISGSVLRNIAEWT